MAGNGAHKSKHTESHDNNDCITVTVEFLSLSESIWSSVAQAITVL